MGVNKVTLLGNLGKDPEIKYLENDRMRASFTVATNETYKNKQGEKVTNTEWHNVVLWSPLAKIAEQYLSKGKQIYLEGKLVTRSYTDKEGNSKYITEIVGQNLVLLGNSDKPSASSAGYAGRDAHVGQTDEADDLPF